MIKFTLLLFLLSCITASFPVFVHAQEQPQLQIISPTNDQTILGNEITVSFLTGNIIFGKEGHIHLWLDTPQPVRTSATEIPAHAEYSLTDLPQGKHEITLELVKPDHTSFSTPIRQTSTFIIKSPTPRSDEPINSSPLVSWIASHFKELSIGSLSLLIISLGIVLAKKFT